MSKRIPVPAICFAALLLAAAQGWYPGWLQRGLGAKEGLKPAN